MRGAAGLKIWLLVMVGGLAWPVHAKGQEDGEGARAEDKLVEEAVAGGGTQAPAPRPPDIGYTATVMLFGAGLLAMSAWGVRRYYRSKRGGGAHVVEVVDTVRLDGGDRVTLIKVGGRRVLVGRGGGRMAGLDAWSAEEVGEERGEVEEGLARASRRFHRRLSEANRSVSSEGVADQDGAGERDRLLASLRELEGKHGGSG